MNAIWVAIKAIAGFVTGAFLVWLGGCVCSGPVALVAYLSTRNSDTALFAGIITQAILTLIVGIHFGYIFIKPDLERWEAEAAAEAARIEAEAARVIAESNRRLAEAQRKEAQEMARRAYLAKLPQRLVQSYQCLQGHLVEAERHLAWAEREFATGAFAPFWDQLETATMCLVAYDEGSEILAGIACEYFAAFPNAELPAGVSNLPNACPALEQLVCLNRKGQTNINFAMIFQQRRTNQILIAGFGSLALAIDSLGTTIAKSMRKLQRTLRSPRKQQTEQ